MTKLMGGGGTATSRMIVADNPYSLILNSNYDVEVIDKLYVLKISHVEPAIKKTGLYGWIDSSEHTTSFYGSGTAPLAKLNTGEWLSQTLFGHTSSDTYYVSGEIAYHIRIEYFQCQYMKSSSDESKQDFYIILTTNDLNSYSKQFYQNNNFILFDSTRNDGAEIILHPILEDQYEQYKFICEHSENIYEHSFIVEFIGKDAIDKALSENGLFKEIFDLATAQTEDSMTLSYNFRFEEI